MATLEKPTRVRKRDRFKELVAGRGSANASPSDIAAPRHSGGADSQASSLIGYALDAQDTENRPVSEDNTLFDGDKDVEDGGAGSGPATRAPGGTAEKADDTTDARTTTQDIARDAADSVTIAPDAEPVVAPDAEPVGSSKDSLVGNDGRPRLEASLWDQAFDNLDAKDQKRLEKSLGFGNSKTNETTDDMLDSVVKVVTAKKEKAEKDAWKFTFAGRTRYMKDELGKIVTWLVRFKEVGDIVVQFDPVHAALPWAAFRFILQTLTMEREQEGIILLCLERIAKLVMRCRIYQRMYLRDHQTNSSEVAERLEQAMIVAFQESLSFVSLALTLEDKSVLGRAMHGIFNPSRAARHLSSIKEAESQLIIEAGVCNEELLVSLGSNTSQLSAEYSALKHLMEDDLVRLNTTTQTLLTSLQHKERCDLLQWLSPVAHETDHENKRKGRVDGTGEWLLAHPFYRKWRDSASSTIFWLHGIRKSRPPQAPPCIYRS